MGVITPEEARQRFVNDDFDFDLQITDPELPEDDNKKFDPDLISEIVKAAQPQPITPFGQESPKIQKLQKTQQPYPQNTVPSQAKK